MTFDPNQLPLGTKLEHPCPECGSAMLLRQSKFGLFYGCIEYPKCKAAHGAHADGKPLGTPANPETKKARIRAHDAFDELWKGRHMSRSEAYTWMQRTMGLPEDEAHIGKFTIDQCEELEVLVGDYLEEREDK
jgi:hypothetical protein